jgi:hypothetical protein
MSGRLRSFPVTVVVIHTCFLISGWLIGWGLDKLVWSLSYDYVFPPNLFARSALLTSWLAAAIVVCALSWFGTAPLSIVTVLQSTIFSLFISLLVFVAALTLLFVMTTIGWNFPGVTAVGPRRHLISAAVPFVGSSAAALGCIIFLYLSCRRRIEQ